MNVDVKGDSEVGRKYCKVIDAEKVWRTCRLARWQNVHIEVTTLIIPGVNDSEAMLRTIAGRIVTELGPNVPWHITRYYPAYHFSIANSSLLAGVGLGAR